VSQAVSALGREIERGTPGVSAPRAQGGGRAGARAWVVGARGAPVWVGRGRDQGPPQLGRPGAATAASPAPAVLSSSKRRRRVPAAPRCPPPQLDELVLETVAGASTKTTQLALVIGGWGRAAGAGGAGRRRAALGWDARTNAQPPAPGSSS
jgi:hypothetical protein